MNTRETSMQHAPESSSSTRPRMIFHHPGEIYSKAQAGSQVRPAAMLQAFEKLGYHVTSVVGSSKERRLAIREIEREVKAGAIFEFIYSESRSIPTLLADSDRIPRAPFMDFCFFARMRKRGVPVGLFYRDLFWRFKMYRTHLPWYGRLITHPLYRYDWWQYRRTLDHLFTPSEPIKAYLPSDHFSGDVSVLPPGVALSELEGEREPSVEKPTEESLSEKRDASSQAPLNLFYVGGISPPAYDLTPMLEVVERVEGVTLTLCCRPAEWERIRSFYQPLLNDRVQIVHRSGEELLPLYQAADLFGMFWKGGEYLNIATPVKLFETLGHALPVLTTASTESGRVVSELGMGWVADELEEAVALLQRLITAPEEIAECRSHMQRVRHQHTWEKRAEQAAETLRKYRHP